MEAIGGWIARRLLGLIRRSLSDEGGHFGRRSSDAVYTDRSPTRLLMHSSSSMSSKASCCSTTPHRVSLVTRPATVVGSRSERPSPGRYRRAHPAGYGVWRAGGAQRTFGMDASHGWGRRSDGSAFPAEVSLSALDVDGQVHCLPACAMFLLESNGTGARSQREPVPSDLRMSPVAMALIYHDGEFITGNQAFHEQTGY